MKAKTKNPEKAVLLAVLLMCGICPAAELYVPSQYPTIQAGIDAAIYGDTVIVADGVYTGEGNRDIDFRGKAITVRSENGPENCIIDCENLGAGFYFYSEEDRNSVLDGLTIKKGAWVGIYCEMSGPTITNCIITGNSREGGITCYESSAVISNCVIKGNSIAGIRLRGSDVTITACNITANGRGILCDGSNCILTTSTVAENNGGILFWGDFLKNHLIITDCNIIGNSRSGGVQFEMGAKLEITNCSLAKNRNLQDGGGAIYCGDAMEGKRITNCNITGNKATQGAGIYIYGANPADIANDIISNCNITGNVTEGLKGQTGLSGGIYTGWGIKISNCIIWDNWPAQIYNAGSDASVSYSDVQGGWEGEGNINVDPCFVEAGHWDANGTADVPWDDFWVEGDYRLRRESLCVDAGTDANVYTDIEGNLRPYDFPGIDNNGDEPEFDMGAYELTSIEVQVSLTPRVLNCRSKGRWVKAHIVLPEGISAEDIDVNAPALLVPFGVESQYVRVVGNNPMQLEIGFGREAICKSLGEGGEIEATVVGSLADGRYFSGSDVVKVKK
jgi:hypothetical protein